MAGLVLRATSKSRQSAEFDVELDSTEPYLNDHRPGGHPLFGTVMGLELMARSVTKTKGCPPSMPTHVAQVVVRDPIIFTAPSATAYVQVTRAIAERGERFHCEVVTRGDTVATRFSATLRCAMPTSHTTAKNVWTVDSPLPVQASDVYALFFHGPTFRVIQRAGLVHDEVVAEVATSLPALTTDPHDNVVLAPRLIEACLQTAGLLEIATRSRMMIPSRIANIEFLGDHTSIPDRLFTRARRSVAPHGPDAVDIDVVDLDGACWLKVSGYETLPLPFPSDSTAIGELNQAFHREPRTDN
jgi:Polyketide synthase dehydratase